MPRAAGYRTNSFVHQGHQLVYDTYGRGGRLLVYTHGLLLDANLNRGIAGAGGTGQPGRAARPVRARSSDKPEHASKYRMDRYVDQVFALLDELGVDDAVLGGLSLGANVSLLAAANAPAHVHRLMLEMPVLERATAGHRVDLRADPSLRITTMRAAGSARRSSWRRIPARLRSVEQRAARGIGRALRDARPCSTGCSSGRSHRRPEQRVTLHGTDVDARPRADVLHPFDGARYGSHGGCPDAEMVRARSPFELRLHPQRLTQLHRRRIPRRGVGIGRAARGRETASR